MKVLKFFIFSALFFVFSFILAFLLKDDANSYSRVLTHEFYKQENIDILLCGASHVSHGLDPRIADVQFGKNTFNSGTPNQNINGTLAIVKTGLKKYKVSTIFLESDFATACREEQSHRRMGTSDLIVASFLKDPVIKWEFIKRSSSPDNIFNALLPIGKDKLMTLSPKKTFKKFKSIITGEFF